MTRSATTLIAIVVLTLQPSYARAQVEPLSSPAAPGGAEPYLATAADGRVYMSWIEPADSVFALRFAVLDQSKWSAPQTIRAGSDFFLNWADFPSIRVLGRDRLAVHWLQREGTGTYAYGVRLATSRDNGRSWSAPIKPHRDTTRTEHGFVALWPEQDGVGAAWLDGRKFGTDSHSMNNEMMLMSTSLRADGSLGPETILDSRTCDCCQNAAALTSRGTIVAYRNRSDDEIRDIYVARRVGGKWTPGVPVHDDNWKIPACPVNGPAIAAAGERVALAWFTAADDRPRVHVAFSNNAGASFGKPVRVDAGNPAGRVDVALLRDGSALVSWIERTGGDTATVQMRRVRQNRRAAAPITIATSSAARASGFPRMAVTPTHIVFAWTVVGKPSAVRVARLPLRALR